MTQARRAARIGAVVLLASVALYGCGADRGTGDVHHGQGVVRDVDTQGRRVTLEHGDIPGLMQAMTMTFAVAEGVPLDALRPGAKVDFDLRADGHTLTVVRLEPR